MRRKRLITGTVAAACAAAVALTGTFAWQSIANAVNNFSGTKVVTPVTTNPGANLHDDFNSATGDKKIYVENTGDSKVYVRVRLGEYKELGSSTPTQTVAYTDHIPVSTGTTQNVADCDLDNFHTAGTNTDGTNYFEWTMGTGANAASHNFNSITGTTQWTGAANQQAKDQLVADQSGDALAGTGNTYDSNAGKSSTVVDTSGSAINKATIASNGVITMAQYNAKTDAEKKAFTGWVYDTDGYAYWSQPLDAGQATGDLLSKVSLPAKDSLDYYYSIKATMEYVDQKDIGAWTEDGTDGHRTYSLNENGQCTNFPGANSKGNVIQSGSQAGGTTIQASDAATAMLNNISNNPATGISVNTKAMSLKVGGTGTLTATVTTADGAKTTDPVVWTSSDPTVATVDSTGKVTALKDGTATITATAGTKSATTTVTVSKNAVAATGITATPNPANVTEGSTVQLTAAVTPADATDKTVTWKSSDPTVATVSSTGLVTGIKAGTVTVTATNTAGNTAQVPVTVAQKAVNSTSITLNVPSVTATDSASPVTVAATLSPTNTTDSISATSPVTWKIKSGSSTEVVSVTSNDNGKSVTLTPKKAGTTTLVASYTNGNGETITKEIPVTITETASTAVTLDKTTLGVDLNQTGTVTASVPTTATDKSITWSLSDDTVASISSPTSTSGTAITVTPLKVGTTVLTATDAAGNKTTCTISCPSQELDTLLHTDNTAKIGDETKLSRSWYHRFEIWEAWNSEHEVAYYYYSDSTEMNLLMDPEGNQTAVNDTDHFYGCPTVDLSFYVGTDTSDYTWEIEQNDAYNGTIMRNNQVVGTHLWTYDEMINNYAGCNATAMIKITQKSTGRSTTVPFKYSAYALII